MLNDFVSRQRPHLDYEDTIYNKFQKAAGMLRAQGVATFGFMRDAVLQGQPANYPDIDILISKNARLFANVEIKKSLSAPQILNRALAIASRTATQINLPLCIVCSEEELYYSTNQGSEFSHIPLYTVDDLCGLLSENVIEDDADVTWPEFKTHLEELIGRSKLGEAKKDSLLSTINDIADNDVTVNNADEGVFSISSVDDPNNVYAFEDKLFEILVGGQFNGERLCRYTSLYSLYRTINEQSQSMCSIVCMNDKTETDYVTNWVGNNNSSLFTAKEANGCYILSCCDQSQSDDLTFWRLYGDDGNGVCINYKVNRDILQPFIIAPVCYANENGEHPELDFIKNMLNTQIHHRRLVLQRFQVWKHFFKPYEYSIEKEIRLLFHCDCQSNETDEYRNTFQPPFKRKWIYNDTYNILAPIVTFGIKNSDNKFPLEIESIILGPKTSERLVNKGQIGIMIDNKGVKHCAANISLLTSESSINHYR